jgi:hypothetical protein
VACYAVSLNRRTVSGAMNPRWKGHTRLHRDDVKDIRQWVRSEGFGMALVDQVAALQEAYPLNARTLEDVIRNQSWFDATYDRTVPLLLEEPSSPIVHSGPMLYLILLALLIRGALGGTPRGTARSRP